MKDANHLNVRYEYVADGHRRTGRTVAFHTLVYPETVGFAERYPADADVVVHYDPDRPDEAVLLPGPREGRQRFSDIILAIIAVVAGASVGVAGSLGILG